MMLFAHPHTTPRSTQATANPTVEAAKQLILNSSLVKEILQLHKRTGHPSRASMSTTILNSTWISTHKDITPPIIIRTLDRLQCTACGLTKRNRKAINEGTGIHPPLPASELFRGLPGPHQPTLCMP